MKLKTVLSGLLALALVAGISSGCATHHNAKLEGRAKISEAQARQIAMSKVPNGKIKTGELEDEKGKLIWSFDIATPGTKDITEVNIDAITGAVIAVDVESAEKEAKEAKEEKEHEGKKHKKGEKDDDDEKEEKK